MADTANITTNVVNGSSITSNLSTDVTIISTVNESTSVSANVVTGARGETTPDSTDIVKGKLKLTGDLAGTADLPTVPGLLTKVGKGDLIVNVKDFGATGDGVTDDTLAIQAAIDSISQSSIAPNTLSQAYRYGGIVLLPRGKYRTTNTIYVPAYTTLTGQMRVGFGNLAISASTSPGSVIWYDPASGNKNTYAVQSGNFVVSTGARYTSNNLIDGTDIDNGTYSEVRDMGVEHLTIQAASTGILGGLHLNGAANSQVMDVSVKGFINCIRSESSWAVKMQRIHAETSEANAIGVYIGGDSNGVSIDAAYSTTNQTNGTAFKFFFATGCSFNGLIAEKSYTAYWEEASYSNTFVGVYAEKIANNIFYIKDCSKTRIININLFSSPNVNLVEVDVGITNGIIEGLTDSDDSLLTTFRLGSSTANSAFVQLSFRGIEPTTSDTFNINNSGKVVYEVDPKTTYLTGTQYRRFINHDYSLAEYHDIVYSFRGTDKYIERWDEDGWGIYNFTSGALKFYVDNTNNRIRFGSSGIILDQTTGNQFGTASVQKLAFWGSTPIARPSGNILTALTNIGLISSPTISYTDLSIPISTKTAAYTITSADHTILCNATTAAFTVNLPAAASNSGRIFVIKKIDASPNAITIDGNAAETIDGATTQTLSTQWATLTIQSNGTSWFII